MPERRIATVLMLDVVGSTHVAAELGDVRYRELSSRFNRIVRSTLKRFGGREEDHAGDGFFATFPQPDRAIRCALALAEEVRALGVEIRSGIHTGQIESQEDKAHGIAVVIGARVMSLAGAGEILVTSTTKELVTGSGFGFEDLSAHELKGVPGTWQVFALTAVEGHERARPLPAAEAAERRAAMEPSVERQRPHALVAAGAVVLLAIAAIGFVSTRGRPGTSRTDRSASTVPSGSIVHLATNGETLAFVHVGTSQDTVRSSSDVAADDPLRVGQGGVWTVRQRRILVHIDPRAMAVRTRIPLDVPVFARTINIAEGLDAIWASHGQGLIEVKPATDVQSTVARLPAGPLATTVPADVAVGLRRVWVGTIQGSLLIYDPATDHERSIGDLDPIDAIAVGHGAVWTVDTFANTVTCYDPRTLHERAQITVDGADAIVVGEVGVWVLARTLGTLTRIDPSTNETAGVVQVGPNPTAIAAGGGTIWVGDEDGAIRRVEEDTRQVTAIAFGAEVIGIAYDDGTDGIWVDVA